MNLVQTKNRCAWIKPGIIVMLLLFSTSASFGQSRPSQETNEPPAVTLSRSTMSSQETNEPPTKVSSRQTRSGQTTKEPDTLNLFEQSRPVQKTKKPQTPVLAWQTHSSQKPGKPATITFSDSKVQQASASSCASCGHRGLSHGGGCASCGSCGHESTGRRGCNGVCPSSSCGDCCVPGQTHCCSFCEESSNPWQRLCCGLYHGICCPDPCYEPRWIPVANAAFWVDDARPVSHIRLRYNGLFDVEHPDRAEYYVGNDNDIINNNDQKLRAVADINEFRLYSETAIGQTFGIFIDLPWRDYDQVQSNGEFGDTGFGDMIVGTKSVLLDSEIWVVSFQFSTFIPTGAGDFLGTRHVSLEPSILTYTKMSRDCYVQFQSAFWIPLGGLQTGNVWHNRLSVNYVLCRILPDVPLIGTLEFVNYNVLTGGFDDNGVTGDGTGAYFGVGPGLRLDVCERIDVGVGSMFSLTDDFFESQGVRVDFRWRF